eukprot:gene17631-biopygen26599
MRVLDCAKINAWQCEDQQVVTDVRLQTVALDFTGRVSSSVHLSCVANAMLQQGNECALYTCGIATRDLGPWLLEALDDAFRDDLDWKPSCNMDAVVRKGEHPFSTNK